MLWHPFFVVYLEVLTIAKLDHQLNEEIRDKEIRLIGADGAQLGIMSAAEALALAEEQGADLVKKGGTDSLKGLKKTLFTKPAQLVFEMDILKSTDDALDIDFHYCPLVKAWQKAGCSDEEIAMLCDIAMCGDHGIGECYGSVLDLPKCIAKGDDVCSLRYHKKNN